MAQSNQQYQNGDTSLCITSKALHSKRKRNMEILYVCAYKTAKIQFNIWTFFST